MLIDASSISSVVRNPRFIVLEGLNGAGKTSAQETLCRFLAEKGLEVVKTREPGSTRLGMQLRSLLLEEQAVKVAPLAELFLFAADRAQHVKEIIAPAIQANKVVVCDRYFYSTTAFQGYGRGLDLNTINAINSLATDGLKPDLVLLLDIDPSLGLKRNRLLADKSDSFEKEDLAFQGRVRQGFLDIAKTSRESFAIVDAAAPIDTVHNAIINLVKKLW